MGCGSWSRPLPRLARPGAGLVPVPVPADAPPRPASGTAGACPSSPLKGCRVQEGRAALLGAVFLFLSRFPFPTDVSPTQRGGCTAHIGPWCEDGGVSRCVVSFPRRRQGLGLPPGHPQPGRWPVTAPHPGMGTPAQRSLTLTPTGLGWDSGPGSVCEHGCVRARWCGGRGRGPACSGPGKSLVGLAPGATARGGAGTAGPTCSGLHQQLIRAGSGAPARAGPSPSSNTLQRFFLRGPHMDKLQVLVNLDPPHIQATWASVWA